MDLNEYLVLKFYYVILENKLDGWRDGGIKEKKLMFVVNVVIIDFIKILELMEIIKV